VYIELNSVIFLINGSLYSKLVHITKSKELVKIYNSDLKHFMIWCLFIKIKGKVAYDYAVFNVV
jgi:hypothetical protein